MATAASSRLGPVKIAIRPAISAPSPPAMAKGAQSGPGKCVIESLADAQDHGHHQERDRQHPDERTDESLQPQPPKDPSHRLFELAHHVSPTTGVPEPDHIEMV